MKIINTMNKIMKMKIEIDNDSSDYLSLWKNYMSELPEIMKLCHDDMKVDNQYDQVMKESNYAFTDGFDRIKRGSMNFDKIAVEIENRLVSFCPQAKDTELYYYVGLSNAAGWATEINNIGTILIGAEKVAYLKWDNYEKMKSLLAHELAHETHRLFRKESIDQVFEEEKLNSIWHIYIEGYGQRVQQIIADDSTPHQDDGKWLNYCIENEERLIIDYYNRTINNESTQEYFGDWYTIEGYSDIGYYLGSQWINWLHKTYTFEEIAIFTMLEIVEEFIRFFGH